jgi:integrase
VAGVERGSLGGIGSVDELCALLRTHKTRQDAERLRAGQLWTASDAWIFATETGEAISPSTDRGHWKALLAAAGVRDGRLHDARHTAATVLLVLGVSERMIMGVMGWSDAAMIHRYAHMVDPIRKDIAARVGDLLWGPDATLPEPN